MECATAPPPIPTSHFVLRALSRGALSGGAPSGRLKSAPEGAGHGAQSWELNGRRWPNGSGFGLQRERRNFGAFALFGSAFPLP